MQHQYRTPDITIDPNILKDIKRVIAVAGGQNKGDSVLGALRGGYVNTLVTDVKTAKYILKNF